MRLFEDPVAGLLVGRLACDQLVEGRLRVEHHRPQLALHLDPLLLEQGRLDPARLVAELLQPERVRQPLRRVDRQHADLQPLRRHPGRDRRRGRRLADPAGAGADADRFALEDFAERGHQESFPASSPRRLDVELGLEEEGQGFHRRLDAALQPGQLLALRAGAAELRERRPRRRPGGAVLALGQLARAPPPPPLLNRSG